MPLGEQFAHLVQGFVHLLVAVAHLLLQAQEFAPGLFIHGWCRFWGWFMWGRCVRQSLHPAVGDRGHVRRGGRVREFQVARGRAAEEEVERSDNHHRGNGDQRPLRDALYRLMRLAWGEVGGRVGSSAHLRFQHIRRPALLLDLGAGDGGLGAEVWLLIPGDVV